MGNVLDGLKVLDLSWGIAGPMTAMLLADHGAQVTRIERPEGDPFPGLLGYGRDTVSVLAEVGYSREDISALAREGAIHCDPPLEGQKAIGA